MMKVTLRFSSLFFGLFLWSVTAWAQPSNDFCVDATLLDIYNSREEAIPTDGDTRNAADALNDNIPSCSVNFRRDGVWYAVVAPDPAPEYGWIIELEYGSVPSDINAVGFALYASCDTGAVNQPLYCTVTSADNLLHIDDCPLNIIPGETYYLHVWSAAGIDPWQEGWGTFRIFAYLAEPDQNEALWGDEPGQGDFAGGINDWTAVGLSCLGADASNAMWVWDPIGSALSGAYAAGQVNSSPSYCNGAMVFNSDYLDNFGVSGQAALGTGPCPAPQSAHLISPVIDISEFNVASVVLQFHQGLREYQSNYFISYSLDGGNSWVDTIQINQDVPLNSDHINEIVRVPLPGAEGASQLVVRFMIVANYYYWVIDDVKILEREADNMRIQSNFYAIAPFASIPANQLYPFGALADVLNAGGSAQTNVVLNHMVVNTSTQAVVYDEDLDYGTVPSDMLVENRLNPVLIDLPKENATYMATYSLMQDQTDFDPSDNQISFGYTVGGDVFALEDGFTRSVAVATGPYDPNAPLSYGYGNYFRPVEDAVVERIIWGVANPDSMVGKTVQIYLLQWTDLNNDRIAESNERKFIGVAEHTFAGGQGSNVIFESILDNFENPGDPIIMRGGFGYIAIVEYQATDRRQFFLLASEARDFGAQVLAMDTAQAWGLVDFRIYSSVLAFSPDGNLANIDYEVTNLPDPNRIFFGHDIVPLVRVVTFTINTNDQLLPENLISAYPNPATDQIQVKLDFIKPYSDVKLRLIDPLGKVVYFKSMNQTITDHVETIDIKRFPAGNYMLQVETPDGQRSTPVIVIR